MSSHDPDSRDLLQLAGELLSALGAPPRMIGRTPLFSRILCSGVARYRRSNAYARCRFGRWWKLRPWLMLDIAGVQAIEEMINNVDEDKIIAFKDAQNTNSGMVAVIVCPLRLQNPMLMSNFTDAWFVLQGALVAQAGLTALQLPSETDLHYTVRGFFTLSLMTSFLGVFFAVLQQRSFGLVGDASAIRNWLSNGVIYHNYAGRVTKQSSLVSYWFLQFPFEIVSVGITFFLIGFGLYLGFTLGEGQNMGFEYIGNQRVMIVYVIGTVWTMGACGMMLGFKDLEEMKIYDRQEEKFEARHPPAATDSSQSTENCKAGIFHSINRPRSQQGLEYQIDPHITELFKEAAAAHLACAVKQEEIANVLASPRRQY